MRALRAIGAAAVLAVVTFGAIMLLTAGTGSAAGACTKFAAPAGSDANAGTEARPFRTVQRLSDSIGAGDVGCLRAGTYTGDVTVTSGGSSTADATITAYPDEKATIEGRLRITRTAQYLTIEDLTLLGIEQGNACGGLMCPSPTVNADHVSFLGNDVTNDHNGICFVLGDANGVYGRADGGRVIGNRIHDCGVLPATNHDHGIYAQAITGGAISDNYIYDNADKGINFYPDADQLEVTRNVIYGNGQGVHFGSAGSQASEDNVVERNVISDSRIRFNVQSATGGGADPSGNVVDSNCLYGSHIDDWYNWEGGIEVDDGSAGYTVTNSVIPSSPGPGYIDASTGDFRLVGTSACLSLFRTTSAISLSADTPSPIG
jgi:hypothetical protein